MSTQRLGLAVIPGAGWRARDVRTVARQAEAAGFDAIFTTEVNNDALATAQLMGSATTHIQIGTWIASIYLRRSHTCAKGASLIADDTGGRFVLGLGVSHQPVNDVLTVDMSNAPADLYRYAIEVRNWLDGNGPATHLPQRPAPVRVPIYLATLSLAAVERAAEFADGIMPTMWSRNESPKARRGPRRAAPGHRTSRHWTSRWDCRHSSGTTSILSGTPLARTWRFTPSFPTSRPCGARAVSASRPIR